MAIVLVHKWVRQDSVVSLILCNNNVQPVQNRVATSRVSKGIDVSLMVYADDLLSLNRMLIDYRILTIDWLLTIADADWLSNDYRWLTIKCVE